MARIFLSHVSEDAQFASRLATSLRHLGHEVWLEQSEIRVGDSILRRVDGGIAQSDFVAVVLTKDSTSSPWIERQWEAKYWDELRHRRIMVLPIVVDDCSVPTFLQAKQVADFRQEYEIGLVGLAASLLPEHGHSGIVEYYPDFVDIGDTWLTLFRDTLQVDLLVMYSATWRNTYFKVIRELLQRPNSRVRVVVPLLTPDGHLLHTYASRLGVAADDLAARFTSAVSDFSVLASAGNMQIYATDRYLTHACYLFSSGGILALYSYATGRTPTPAFLLTDGSLLTHLRNDFEWVIQDANSTMRLH